MVGRLFDEIHRREPLVLDGGSVPDLATEQPHSYHRSWSDSPHDGGYSVRYFTDRHPVRSGRNWACALDLTFRDPVLMMRYTARLHHFVLSRPRCAYTHGLAEFAGTLDGRTVFAWDTRAGARTYGWDDSHLWHIHLSLVRRYVNTRRVLNLAWVFSP